MWMLGGLRKWAKFKSFYLKFGMGSRLATVNILGSTTISRVDIGLGFLGLWALLDSLYKIHVLLVYPQY